MADFVIGRELPTVPATQLSELAARWTEPLGRSSGENVFGLRAALEDLMWQKVGVVRNGRDLTEAVAALGALKTRVENLATPGDPSSNPPWNEAMNLANLCVNAEMVARSALLRTESRGAHYREDYPAADPTWLRNIYLTPAGEEMKFQCEPVKFARLAPE
jgi:succinate dehydrogenase/fumarate reductase flavoprotein subunit